MKPNKRRKKQTAFNKLLHKQFQHEIRKMEIGFYFSEMIHDGWKQIEYIFYTYFKVYRGL